MEIGNRGVILSNDNCNTCRVCLITNQSNQRIFGVTQHDMIDLSEKIRLCCGVEVLENDGLPSTICTKCISKVNDAHELRKQCQRSDIRLRELYGKPYNVNPQNTMKDQYCQADHFFDSNLIKVNDTLPKYKPSTVVLEDTEETKCIEECDANNETECIENCDANNETECIEECDANNETECIEKCDANNETECIEKCDAINETECIEERDAISETKCIAEDELNTASSKQNTSVKCKESQYKKNVGREAYRTRWMTMLKRMTAIESLRNYKERQRKYIKKNAKQDENLRDKKSNSQTSYVCPMCSKCYSRKRSFDMHVSTHGGESLNTHEKLIEHNKLHLVEEKSKIEKNIVCKICYKKFGKTNTLVRHLNAHKRVYPMEVLSILKEIREQRKLENILESERSTTEVKNNDRQGTIEQCAINKSTLNALTNETLESENKETNVESLDNKTENTCSTNEEHCGNEKSLRKLSQLAVKKKYICTVCNMKFYRQARLDSHKIRHGHDENAVSLEVQNPFDDESAIKLINTWIREELDSDNEEKEFPCETCGKSYSRKKTLYNHQRTMHNEECAECGKICTCDGKRYQCDDCDKSFNNKLKLQRHVRIHERGKEQEDANFKRFLCHICSKTFRQNTGLMFHMRTHTGDRPHLCKFCGKGFTSNSNCLNHERTHTGDRPFVCHYCSAAFAKSCTLKAHLTTHTGEANYHCRTCGKSFRRLKYLKEHEFTHTGEKPYVCKICGAAYGHSGSLFVHEKKCNGQPTLRKQRLRKPKAMPPNVTPIIMALPTYLTNIEAMNPESNNTYINNVQMLNSQSISNVNPIIAPDLHINSNADVPDVSLAVQNFALIGQMF